MDGANWYLKMNEYGFISYAFAADPYSPRFGIPCDWQPFDLCPLFSSPLPSRLGFDIAEPLYLTPFNCRRSRTSSLRLSTPSAISPETSFPSPSPSHLYSLLPTPSSFLLFLIHSTISSLPICSFHSAIPFGSRFQSFPFSQR